VEQVQWSGGRVGRNGNGTLALQIKIGTWVETRFTELNKQKTKDNRGADRQTAESRE
jgi:hypothetical protein